MRRRQDDWINATHILKVAEQQKASRTRILEREIQKDLHEKIQGGYGKFQGTWVPLQKGKELAERNGVYQKLRPLFEYKAGDISPPQAPKHTTAASNKTRPLMKTAPRTKKITTVPTFSQMDDDRYNSSPPPNGDDSAEDSSFPSDSNIDEQGSYQRSQQPGASRKRKREHGTGDHQDLLYADALLDYFILCGSEQRSFDLEYPLPPPGFPIDRQIDNQNHTALHWGAAMGDIAVVNTFLGLGADMRARNIRGETPIHRAVIFTNNHAKGTIEQLVDVLHLTIQARDSFGATVFHHAATLTLSHSKKKCARYYLEVLLSKLSESTTQQEFFNFVNLKDYRGDTALHIVARNDAKKCVHTLQGHGAASDIPNGKGETVDQIIHHSRKLRADHYAFGSSSPLQPDLPLPNGNELAKVSTPAIIPSTSQCESQSAQSFRDSFSAMLPDKALQMALDMEEAIHEKDSDLAEANRLLENMTMELNQVRQQIALLESSNGDSEEDDDDEQQLLEEAEALQAINESLLEQHQHQCLHKDVRAEEQNLPPSAHHDLTKSNGELPGESELDRKIRAARDLAQMQSQRKSLANAVVQAQATAGMSEKGESYIRLISSATGIPTDEVPAMMPELLEELELSKMDGSVVRPASAEEVDT